MAATYCSVYTYLYQPDGDPLVGIKGIAKIINLPYTVDGVYYGNAVDDVGFISYSNSSGLIRWSLVSGAKFSIEIPYVSLKAYITSPATESGLLEDLI
jgi:hypothetical protein